MERLDAARRHPENQDPAQQAIIRLVRELIVAAGIKDPGVEVGATTVVQTPETPIENKRFSEEALEFLRIKALLVYPLNGRSLKAQTLAGRHFWYIVDAGEDFLTLPSMFSEVAINPSPDKLLLPRSNDATLNQQLEMIADYSAKLQGEFGSKEIKAVMGHVPDYTSLAFQHLKATGGQDYLLGVEYKYAFARTMSLTRGSFAAVVGFFVPTEGIGVENRDTDEGYDDVYAFPLVVPASPQGEPV